MKKLSLLLVVLLAAGSAGLYGQMAIGTNFSISGDATATAGYDLDEEVFGFKSASSANIKIELVAKQSDKKPAEMMSGWYGSIELNDFQIVIDSDNEEDDTKFLRDDGTTAGYTRLYVVEPDIVATLRNGPLFLRIFAAPDNKADLVAAVENDDPDDDDYKAVGDDDPNDVGSEINKGHGITIGYDTADLDLAIGVSSEEEFKEDGGNTQGPYAVSADLGVEVGPARLDIAFAQGFKNNDDATPMDDDDNTGIGGKLTTTFGDIQLSGGADIEMTGDSDDPDTEVNEQMDWEAGANAMVTLTSDTSLKADFITSSRKKVASDVTVEIADKSGLVEDLDMSLKWGMFDISGGDDAEGAPMTENDMSDLLVKGSLDYHLDAMGGKLTPGTTVEVNQLDGSEDHTYVGLEVRAVLTGAIPATEFGLKWNTERLVDSGANEAQQGTVTLWTKIVY
ncbi:MAG: hypothetical protein OXH96_10340 [Spirochaetaceae bacterium]|nr:hypothetical protein [Spirochaetaceae bacterium]